MEWRESRSSYRMWSTHREVFLPFAELQRRETHRLAFFCPISAASSKPLPLKQGRTNASPGARQHNYRAYRIQEWCRDSRAQPVRLLSQRFEVYEPKAT